MVLTQRRVEEIYREHLDYQVKTAGRACARVTIHNRLRKGWEVEKAVKIPRWWHRVIRKVTSVSQIIKKSMKIKFGWLIYKYCNIVDEFWYMFKRTDKCKDWEIYKSFTSKQLIGMYKEDCLNFYVTDDVNDWTKDEKKTDASKECLCWAGGKT